jgi:hypothetical protein
MLELGLSRADEKEMDDVDPTLDPEIVVIERMALSDTERGRTLASAFVTTFGDFMTETVRPLLREMAEEGGDAQLLVNGLAELMRLTAEAIEYPIGSER